MNERKLRLTREAIGEQDVTMPEAEGILRTIGIIALVLFVVMFSAAFPA